MCIFSVIALNGCGTLKWCRNLLPFIHFIFVERLLTRFLFSQYMPCYWMVNAYPQYAMQLVEWVIQLYLITLFWLCAFHYDVSHMRQRISMRTEHMFVIWRIKGAPRAHDVYTTAPQRRCNVIWRCIDVKATLYKCYVPTGWGFARIKLV